MSSPSWPGISQCFSDTSKVTAAVKSLWYPLKMYIVMIHCSFVDQEKQIITGTFCTPSVGGAIESVLCSAFAHPKSHQNVSRAQDSSGNKGSRSIRSSHEIQPFSQGQQQLFCSTRELLCEGRNLTLDELTNDFHMKNDRLM